jgi:hypothetical protein
MRLMVELTGQQPAGAVAFVATMEAVAAAEKERAFAAACAMVYT